MSNSNGNPVSEFIKTVCEQIRAKKTHGFLSDELKAHIEDQKAAYIDAGEDEDNAVKKAVAQMGDPVIVGQQLDRTHRPKPDLAMFIIVAVLMMFGAVIQYFILSEAKTVPENLSVYLSMTDRFINYLLHCLIGIIVLAVIYFADYTILGKHPKIIFALAVAVSLILTTQYFIDISRSRFNGYIIYRYYIALLCIPLFGGVVYSQRKKSYGGILICTIFCGIAVAVLQTSGIFYLTLAYLAIMTTVILKGWFNVKKGIALAMVYAPIIILTVIGFLTVDRLRFAVTNIFVISDPTRYGYMNYLTRSILSGAKPFGKASYIFNGMSLSGIFDERYEIVMLPEWNSGYMLTYIIARFGYIAGIIVVSPVIAAILRMFRLSMKQKNSLGFVISFSATLAFALQTLFYILDNLGFGLQLTSSLPFLSYSGVSFVANMVFVGLVISIFRNSDLVKEKPVTVKIKSRKNKNGSIVSFDGEKITIDLSFFVR